MKTILFLLVVLLLHCNFALAANITVKDCAIGGVAAGWHSTHHYLPQKFNKTALRDVEWQKSNAQIILDKYASVNTVVGFQNIPVGRMSKDETIALFGVLTRRSREAGNLYQAIFEKDPLYIATIAIAASDNMNRSYDLLVTDMETPRGIHLGSSVKDMNTQYGMPDMTEQVDNNAVRYYYYTPETTMKKKSNKKYAGAGMIFYARADVITGIIVYNTYGY